LGVIDMHGSVQNNTRVVKTANFSIEGHPPELQNTAGGIFISGSPTMLLRLIILYQKSYSQLSTRCSTTSLESRMFRVILASDSGINPGGTGRNWQRYSHDIHKLFAELGVARFFLRGVTASLTGN
jgi:hypothetical protein